MGQHYKNSFSRLHFLLAVFIFFRIFTPFFPPYSSIHTLPGLIDFMESPNPCLGCGACCAFFRASFYWGEASDAKINGVPVELTEKLYDFKLVMKGTNQTSPWCIALNGIIGKAVHYTIHFRRAAVCRDFVPSWQLGEPNPRCDQARAHWGLAPLTPNSWVPRSPGQLPRAA